MGGLIFREEKTDALISVSDYVKILALYDVELYLCSRLQSYKQFWNFIPTIYSLCHIMQNIRHFIIRKITRVDITIIMLKNGTGAGQTTCSRVSIKLCNFLRTLYYLHHNTCYNFKRYTLYYSLLFDLIITPTISDTKPTIIPTTPSPGASAANPIIAMKNAIPITIIEIANGDIVLSSF